MSHAVWDIFVFKYFLLPIWNSNLTAKSGHPSLVPSLLLHPPSGMGMGGHLPQEPPTFPLTPSPPAPGHLQLHTNPRPDNRIWDKWVCPVKDWPWGKGRDPHSFAPSGSLGKTPPIAQGPLEPLLQSKVHQRLAGSLGHTYSKKITVILKFKCN